MCNHGYTEEEIAGMKYQKDRVAAIIEAEEKSGKQYTSKIPTIKDQEKEEEIEADSQLQTQATKNFMENPLEGIIPEMDSPNVSPTIPGQGVLAPKPAASTPTQTTPKATVKKKINFTENSTFKNHRVPVEKRNAQELKLYELPAAEQRDSLRTLGVSDSEIKALKYEGDRVRKIIELQK